MRLTVPDARRFRGVLDALSAIGLSEEGRAFHPLPSERGTLALVASPLGERYEDSGIIVLCHRPIPLEGAEGTIFCGVREWSAHEHALASPVRTFTMANVSRDGLHEVLDAVMANAREWQNAHLIVHAGILDPAFLPGLPDPSPGGLTSRELLYAIQRLRRLKNLSSAEIIHAGDSDALSEKLIAKLAAELLSSRN